MLSSKSILMATVYIVLSGSTDTVFSQTVPPTEGLNQIQMTQNVASDVQATHTITQLSPTSTSQDFSSQVATAGSSALVTMDSESATTSSISQSPVPTIVPSMTDSLGMASGSYTEVLDSSGSQQMSENMATANHTVLAPSTGETSQSATAELSQGIQPSVSLQQEETSMSYFSRQPSPSQDTLVTFSSQQDIIESMHSQSEFLPTATTYFSVPVVPSGTTSFSPAHAPSESGKTDVSKADDDDGLSSGGKAAVGIVVTIVALGLIIGGIVLYRRHNFTHRSLKSFLTSGVRYKTYNNATYKDDEGMLIMPDRR